MTKRARRREPLPLWFTRGALIPEDLWRIPEMIKLGSYAKDCITNFSGVVTGHAEYITGCDQYLLSPRTPDKEPKWFDEQRLDVDPIIAPVTLDNSNGSGADIAAPVK